MAKRKARSRSKSTSRGRSAPARRASSSGSRRRTASRRPAAQTLRIVIEQPTAVQPAAQTFINPGLPRPRKVARF